MNSAVRYSGAQYRCRNGAYYVCMTFQHLYGHYMKPVWSLYGFCMGSMCFYCQGILSHIHSCVTVTVGPSGYTFHVATV